MTKLTPDQPSATILAFPVPAAADPEDPAVRLKTALTNLNSALAAQRAALTNWRTALSDLQGSLRGLGTSLNSYNSSLGTLQDRVGTLNADARRLGRTESQPMPSREAT